MKNTTFSPDTVEKPSLNFHLLREEGLAYLQQLSSDHWTDYNAHDPGVTILEQLCFALTDVAYRLEYPIPDLLALPTEGESNRQKRPRSSFFEASKMFSSHAVTIADQRKLLVDSFEEIQNVWIEMERSVANEEKMVLTKRIEILPNLLFNSSFKTDRVSKEAFLTSVKEFLADHRNIAEDVEEVHLLKNENISIEMELFLEDDVVVEQVIARVFTSLFELIYRPVQYHTAAQLEEEGYDIPYIFSGPRLSKGIVKDEILKERLKTLTVYGLQKLVSRVEGVLNCKISRIESENGAVSDTVIMVSPNHFFHLLDEDNSGLNSEARFSRLFKNLTIRSRKEEVTAYNKNKIAHWSQEIWSKKYRQYPQAVAHDEHTDLALAGTYRNLGDYHSIQHYFPLIYGVGHHGISSSESLDRQGKAKQLKGYLMLFEQHLANHLAQIDNLNTLFSIDYNPLEKHSYFHQPLHSVPDVAAMYRDEYTALKSLNEMESSTIFYHRKHRMYDHLLARFGEDLNPLPWKIGYNLHLFSTEEEYEEALLVAKSTLLKKLESLSYYRVLGERFRESKKRNHCLSLNKGPLALRSGLAAMVAAKMGFTNDGNRFTSKSKLGTASKETEDRKRLAPNPEFLEKRPKKIKISRATATDRAQYIPLEMVDDFKTKYTITAEECVSIFGRIALKKMFKRGVDINNYRVSNSKAGAKKVVKVIFDADKNTRWIRLMTCENVEEARQRVSAIIAFLKQENTLAEGMYVVDHILLRDFLETETTAYGFSFLGIDDQAVFEIPAESWASSTSDRDALLKEICTVAREDGNYVAERNSWVLKGCHGAFEGKPILRYQSNNDGYQTEILKEDVVILCREFVALFYDTKNDFGRLRLKEVEGIRLRGNNAKIRGVKGQRRIVFQRKIKGWDALINEDFFNLKITVFVPDWSARFQDSRFVSYLKDVIKERTPAHIQCDIVRLDVDQMYRFEKSYFSWRKSRERGKKEKQVATSRGLYAVVNELKTFVVA